MKIKCPFSKNHIKLFFSIKQLILWKLIISFLNFINQRKTSDFSNVDIVLINDIFGLYQNKKDNLNRYEDFNYCTIGTNDKLHYIRIYLIVGNFVEFIKSYKKVINASYKSFFALELIKLSDIIIESYHEKNYLFLSPNLIVKSIIARNVKAVVLTCEYCDTQKKIILLLKRNSIPTIALQHGIISPSHPAYIYTDPRDMEYLPDITCLYGEVDRDYILNHSNYITGQLIVTGSPRSDLIYYADAIYSRDRFCLINKIPHNHRILLWTTQSHGMTNEENIKLLDLVLGTCDRIPNCTLLIKQHPGERRSHNRLINSYCKQYSCNSKILLKDSDIFEAIHVSDLVITYSSTTGREAVAFRKPLIVLDPLDRAGYCKEGVGIFVSTIEEAVEVINQLLSDDKKLAIIQEKFIKRYFYAIDGKSTERVIQVIENTIRKGD